MKGIVAYDSVYGNTKLVAEAIAEQLRSDGYDVELVSVKESKTAPMGDFMFIGSPTRIGRPTKEAKKFVEDLSVDFWKSRPIVIFDTVGPFPEEKEKREKWLARIEKSAASRLRDLARSRGLNIDQELLHFAVTGFKGPLAPDALAMAKDSAHKFVATLQ